MQTCVTYHVHNAYIVINISDFHKIYLEIKSLRWSCWLSNILVNKKKWGSQKLKWNLSPFQVNRLYCSNKCFILLSGEKIWHDVNDKCYINSGVQNALSNSIVQNALSNSGVQNALSNSAVQNLFIKQSNKQNLALNQNTFTLPQFTKGV